MRVVSTMLALAVSLWMAGNLFAADQKKGHEGREGRNPGRSMLEQWEGRLKAVNLTDDQKTKWEAIKKEYAPKIKDIAEKREKLLTPEQKKAREEAMKAVRTAGKKRDEARKEVEAAVKLTDEQKAKMAEVRKTSESLGKDLREKVQALLTPEQKDLLKSQRGQRGHGRERTAKKAA
jgi:Spy/CpxP family protein refolding chaperone